MIPISRNAFAKQVAKANPSVSESTLLHSIDTMVQAVKNGDTCDVCGQGIWIAGSAVSGVCMCFTCMTGEADSSEDYEIMC